MKSLSSCFRNFLIFSAFLLMNFMYGYAQPDPPSLRCISVEDNGNVTLTWITPLDTGAAFGGYHIFYSAGIGGPYTTADSIFNYTTTTVTVNAVNANNTTLYFYIKTREGCCSNYSVSSDTLRSIRMIVTPLSNERVRLTWNRIHTPPLPTTSTNSAVSKEITTGTYSLFRNTPDTTTLDTNYFCNRFINYRVSVADLSGCESRSSVDGELFRDTKGPSQTSLDTVSIDPLTGAVQISWLPDSSLDTQGYVIYQFNGISYDSIGAVSGINTLSFINALTNSSNSPETYTVAAFDSCKNLGPLAVNHTTIWLQSEVKKCEAVAEIEWTSYQNMSGGVQRYEIWIRDQSGIWTLEALTPSNIQSYVKSLTIPGASYDIVVRAVGNLGHTASSNLISITANILQQPAFIYIRSASVTGSSVEVNCHVDPSGDVQAYLLYSSKSLNGTYSLVATKNYVPASNISFTDAFADADEGPVYYKVTAYDSCGKEFVTSNIAATVFLTADEAGELISNLQWTHYLGWEYPAGSYRIYQVVDGAIQPTPVSDVGGDTLTFEEDISATPFGSGNVCYAILALEDSLNQYGFSDSAWSNVACVPLSPSSYVPNAFTPGGLNPVFRPVVLFENPERYSFRVFNRWGQVVYDTSIPSEGWKGDFNGSESPTGVYAWQLIFRGINRKEYTKSGTVTLIR
jgi:hypothetical protein